MATLINGNGNPAVYAEQDADWFASIMGNVTSITGVGQQFEASILDAQTIGVADGVIITKEGRRIQLDANSVDTFEIPVGEQGTTNYYIIGYHLVTGEDSSQTCDTFAQLMESSSATIQEDTFREGADEVYVSLYRVKQVGLTIDTIEPLLPTIQDLNQLNQNLTELIANNLDSMVNLPLNTMYTCESDGYIRINCAYGSNNYSYVEIYGSNENNSFTFVVNGNTSAGGNGSLYVRKGMKVKFLGGSGNPEAHFHPLVS